MFNRAALHRLVDSLPEEDLPTAARLLDRLAATADAVERALLLAPADDEPDTDDKDGGLTEARRRDLGDCRLHVTRSRRKRLKTLVSPTGAGRWKLPIGRWFPAAA